jgi:chemotaxis protein MotB
MADPLQSGLAYQTRDKEWLPMRTINTWMILAVVAMVAVGCVAQREADDLKTLYRNSQEQVVDLQERLAEADARIAALMGDAGSESNALASALAERDRLRTALDDAEERLRNAGTVVLPPELDDALSRLAEANPQLMSYDAERGMIKLRSDLTFGLGSADVSAGATSSLGSLAKIFKSPSASQYEVRVVGHTDNVPIKNVGTRAKHPTNWHLSVHRAISVMQVLGKAGVPNTRMSVAGYGEFHPVVANAVGGSEANRRVELYLVAMTSAGSAPEPAAAAAPEPVAPAVAQPAPDITQPPAAYK